MTADTSARNTLVDRFFICFVFVASFAWTMVKSSPSIYWGDDGLLITHAYMQSLGHPPGHPAYMQMQRFGEYLPMGDIAHRFVVLSCIWTSTACVLFCCMLKNYCRDRYQFFSGSLAFVSLVLTSNIVIHQAVRAETYALQTAILACILFQMHHQDKLYGLFAVAFGSGLLTANHTLVALLTLPGLFFWLLNKQQLKQFVRFWGIAIIFFFIGNSIYLYLPIRSYESNTMNFIDASKDTTFFNYVSARIYHEQFEINNILGIMSNAAVHLKEFLRVVRDDFGWMGIFFIGFALVTVKTTERYHISRMLALAGIMTAGICSLAIFDMENWDVQGYFESVFLILIFVIVIGIINLWFTIRRFRFARTLQWVIICTLLCARYPFADSLSDSLEARSIAKLFLLGLPEKSTLLTRSDINFMIVYLNRVENLRDDVEVISRNEIQRNVYWSMGSRSKGEVLQDPQLSGSEAVIELIENKVQQGKSIAWEMGDDDGLIRSMSPRLQSCYLLVNPDQQELHLDDRFLDLFRSLNYGQNITWDINALEQLQMLVYNRGHYFLGAQRFSEAIRENCFAVLMNSRVAKFRNNFGVALAKMGLLDQAESQFHQALRLDPGHKGARMNLEIMGNR